MMINTTSQELIPVPDGLKPRKKRRIPRIQEEENDIPPDLLKEINDALAELSENDEDHQEKKDANQVALD